MMIQIIAAVIATVGFRFCLVYHQSTILIAVSLVERAGLSTC